MFINGTMLEQKAPMDAPNSKAVEGEIGKLNTNQREEFQSTFIHSIHKLFNTR